MSNSKVLLWSTSLNPLEAGPNREGDGGYGCLTVCGFGCLNPLEAGPNREAFDFETETFDIETSQSPRSGA